MSDRHLPQLGGSDLLTHSRMQCFKTCRRKHLYRYELGIRPALSARPLRMGAAVHLGLDLRAQGRGTDEAILHAASSYEVLPDWATTDDLVHEWMIERVTVATVLAAYFWFWERPEVPADIRPVRVIESERPFERLIVNPETGRASPIFRFAGKRDQIVEVADGSTVVMENKTTGDGIEPTSDYWLRLRMDQQISGYVVAALDDGHPVTDVLYNVIRKPAIAPKQISVVDSDGIKIVLGTDGQRVRSKDGKKWRESADAAQGWVLQTRTETPDEFGERLRLDISERPNFYFARQRIPRLQADLDEFRAELWQQQRDIREAQQSGRHYRNTSACLAQGRCEFIDHCHRGINVDAVPPGFERVENIHPELMEPSL